MKVLIAVLCVFHIATGYSNCPKYYQSQYNLEKYNDKNIADYAVKGVARSEVTFRLWTRELKNNFIPLYYGHLRDEDAIKPQNPFKFIIHGWTDCADAEWYEYLTQEYLKKGDYNVVEVDWRKPAGALYPVSAAETREVGKFVGEFIVDLHRTVGVPLENIHLIGHSLGAHISGFAGKEVTKQSKGIIGRISALDPAGPLFLLATAANRLAIGDALFIDVIHTDAGKFGHKKVLGDVDFYPNGGNPPQPGCLLYGIAEGAVDVASCSHTRSYYLFGESINSSDFVGTLCDSEKNYEKGKCNSNPTALMGENADPSYIKGVYYLTTNKGYPFAKGAQKF